MSEIANICRAKGEPLRFDIDLKWSLWSKDKEYWLEYAPETFKHIQSGIDEGWLEETGETLEIVSRPRKECRYGKVLLKYSAKHDRVTANVYLVDSWDEPDAIADTLGLTGETTTLLDQLPYVDGEPGVCVEKELLIDSCEELLRMVGQLEDELLIHSEETWNSLKGSS